MEETPAHVHDAHCQERILSCTLDEQKGHIHSEDCCARTLICTQEEPHEHTDACYETTQICGLEETEGHSHQDMCYTVIEGSYICGLEETQGHSHTEACWYHGNGFGCDQTEAQGHIHTNACVTEQTELACGLEATEGHLHIDSCYDTPEVCPLEEHIHVESCYSDITQDLETSDDWEASLADLIRSPSTAENILMVARSQLGNGESARNFQVDAEGVRRGITRYGQWYGNPYGDWSAMFAAFCLDYAGVYDVPFNAGPEAMRLEWEQAQLYIPAEEFEPVPGHLLFLDKDENGTADAVAIITGAEENVIFAIEGDLNEPVTEIGEIKIYPEAAGAKALPEGEDPVDSVLETLYSREDPVLMGYGMVPFAPGLMLLPEGDIAPRAATRTIWLDGTNGGLVALTGSDNTGYTAEEGTTFTLPDSWKSPSQYCYVLNGWYDIINNRYYAPGAQVTVEGDMVFYADWIASTYDVGIYNAQVADTVSTSEFITTHLFDYNALFNLHSVRADITVGSSGHSENWSMVTSGNVGYENRETLGFVFSDGAPSYAEGNLSYPGNRDSYNNYSEEGITPGIYTNRELDMVFATEDALGKLYLGTGDHLFQIMTDPSNEFYGYYYYDAQRNAASYNQSQQRFYVYEYLESPSASVGSTNSGFMPFNSPYANTNGNNTGVYSYDGLDGEYAGISHFQYASSYEGNRDQVLSNFAYGMRTDIRFYLPDDSGTGGNKDIYGNDMHF